MTAGSLAGLLSGLDSGGVRQQFVTGRVLTWSAGDRTVDVHGATYDVSAYDAALASAGIAPGDTALVLIVGNTATVLCALADS